ncbi:DNA primase [Streptomyces sp. ID05-47C]|uniref:DNA primase n=1 Tax=Streptomyces sp. ID05-47C TaxID=3028665 RepID=UPI0029A49F38|nr:DNA primase [Streptomyces sp. ID05-47C]MDX3568114.1 DNA primase [Streptomyces sp. ID05-47C]
MNRVGLGLAIGAGYVLGRTKKMKLAFAVGSMVAGKRLNLTPRALADVVSQQLKDNPQFKEIGDELRQDLRGVGKAASGAMVERQMNALADRLHSRTGQVRDQLQGVVPDVGAQKDAEESGSDRGGKDDRATDEEHEEYDEPESARDEDVDEGEGEGRDGDAADAADDSEERPRRKAPAKAAAKKAANKTAKKAPARTSPTQRTAAPARKTAEKTASRGRRPKGGGER